MASVNNDDEFKMGSKIIGGLVAYRLNLQLFKRSISVLEQKSYRIADWLFNNTFIDALLKTSGAYDAYP